MKLNKIYISAFGGLKDFTLDLTDGLNVIYGNNEDGKSTVAAFIKAMFYGTGRNTKNISDSIRLKYTPWDNSQMAGRIFFEHQNKRYCLEREFRKSDSTDRITLTDLDSGKTIETSENIGQQFFGLSAAAFERSLFIGNGDFIKDDTAAGEINGKLSNIAITGSEDVSFKQVDKNITDTRNKLISKSGRSGSYNEDLQVLDALNSRLEKADNDVKLKSKLNDTAQQKRTDYEALYKKYLGLKEIMDREQDIKNREKLVEFLDTKRRLDEVNQSLTLDDGTIINENFTGKLEFGLNRYKASCDRCEQINEDIARIKQTIELQNASPQDTKEQIDALSNEVVALTTKKENYNTQEQKLSSEVLELNQKLEAVQNKKTTVNPVLLILSIVLASGGATAILVSPIVAAIIIAIAAVLLALSFIIKPKNTSAIAAVQNDLADANNRLAQNNASKNKLQEQINDINARINTLNSVLQADNTIKQQRLDELAQKNDLLRSEQEKANDTLSELLSLLSGFGGIDTAALAQEKLLELKQKTEHQKEIKLQLKTASQYLGNIDYADAEKKLAAINDNLDENVDFDAVKAEFNAVTEELSTRKDELTQIATELTASFKNSENPEELRREIGWLKEKIDAKKAFCDAADIARVVLEESFYELRRGYGSELEKATHNIFARLTDGKYKSVSVTDTLDLSVEKTDVFGTHELDYLSLGTTHQAYLSLRLAIATLISDDSPLPIFLDDSLSQYDDTRTERAIAFLKEFCADGQGILFTCHNSICEIAQKQNIEIQKPYK
ncbi:MAG: hypothetical protein E7521_04570 [Ruminococcaceae bacterium]|nr:hypothetical protein [Oscillospiraceae bacterium]